MAEIDNELQSTELSNNPSFDPEGFDIPAAEADQDEEEELTAIDAELDALATKRKQEEPSEEEPGDVKESPGETSPKTTEKPAAKPSEDSEDQQPKRDGRGTLSEEEIKRMREARRRSREEGTRLGPAPAPRAGARPETPWQKKPAAPGAGPSPFKDPRLAQAEAAGGPPSWLGTRWREIKPEDQREAWVYLRRWVDWFVNEYRLPEQVVPRCWYLHTELVQELYAAMCMEHKAWEEGAASLTPTMMWHPNVAAMKQRLREAVGDLGSCNKGSHKEPERIELDYDENQWRRTAYGRRESTTVARPEPGDEPYLLRARMYDDEGTEVHTPEAVVGVMPVQGVEDPLVQLRRDQTTATGESTIALEAEAVPHAEEVIWEKAEHWSIDDKGAIVAADWKPYEQEGDKNQEEQPGDTEDLSPEGKQDLSEIPEESRL